MAKRIERIDDKLSSLQKPTLEVLDKLFINKNDLLILAAGFEDRALGVLEQAASVMSRDFKIIVIEYEPSLEKNKNKEICEICQDIGAEIIKLTYNRYNPEGAGGTLVDLIHKYNIEGRIFLDISAMSRLFIVQAIVAIGRTKRKFSNLNILYSEAYGYPPDEEEVKSKIEKNKEDTIYRTMFLSSGVYDVTVVPELSSIAMQGQPIRLIAFPSFNTDQLASLRGETYPAYFSLIHGIPPLPKDKWRPGKIKVLNHTEKILNREDKKASTLNYQKTLDMLLEIYKSKSDKERIIIAPTGSKMQTVAVGIFRTFMNDVQVIYPTPKKFSSPQNYTVGFRNIYGLALDAFNIE
ncbi:MAG: hypothetical protein KAW12_10595 [Candidatus Aminicenantes bacterium]|nr:hypothetical protein [Candidatus Aminicenantes bacterium]